MEEKCLKQFDKIYNVGSVINIIIDDKLTLLRESKHAHADSINFWPA